MDASGIVGAVIAAGAVGGILALAHWSTYKDRQREARRRIIATTYDKPFDSLPPPAPRRQVPPAWPVPGRPSPPARPILDCAEAVELHIAEGIAGAEFMLRKVWKQRGHDQP